MHQPKHERLLAGLFAATGLALLAVSALNFTAKNISPGLALFGAGLLGVAGAAILAFPALTQRLRAPIARNQRLIVALAAACWLAWCITIALTYHVHDWDEGAYLLSGMALRGWDVPYAAHRAPVTHLLCALFYPYQRFLNPVLLVILLATLFLFVKRQAGYLCAAFCMLALLCQNIVLESSVDITSELPGAALLLLGFLTLTRRRFWWAALFFTAAVYSRWNFVPIWAVVTFCVFLRFGILQASKFAGAGLAFFAAWWALSYWMGTPNPIAAVYAGNYIPARDWTDVGAPITPATRLGFYLGHFWFLTPPVLVGVIASPIQFLKRKTDDGEWALFVVLPLALLAYIFSMLFIGGLEGRFMASIMVPALAFFTIWLAKIVPEQKSVAAFTVSFCLICGVGLWPLLALVKARISLNTEPIFSSALRAKLDSLPLHTVTYGVPVEPLSRNNGHQAMIEARHRILFPTARRDATSYILVDPASKQTVQELIAKTKAGDYLIVPAAQSEGLQPFASDADWAVVRNPG